MKLIHRGIQRSGTCLSARWVKQAFGIELPRHKGKNAPAQLKHLPLRPQDYHEDHVLLVNIKDPYAWVSSWHAWAVQAKYQGTKHPRVKTPVTFDREQLQKQLDRWNQLYGQWLAWPHKRVVVRYEDILSRSDALVHPLAALLDRKPSCIPPMPELTVRAGDIKKPWLPRIKFDMAFYTEKRYLELLTHEHVSQITDEIDWNLLRGLYQPISSLQGAEHVAEKTA
jgi:hypothetical protein